MSQGTAMGSAKNLGQNALFLAIRRFFGSKKAENRPKLEILSKSGLISQSLGIFQ